MDIKLCFQMFLYVFHFFSVSIVFPKRFRFRAHRNDLSKRIFDSCYVLFYFILLIFSSTMITKNWLISFKTAHCLLRKIFLHQFQWMKRQISLSLRIMRKQKNKNEDFYILLHFCVSCIYPDTLNGVDHQHLCS